MIPTPSFGREVANVVLRAVAVIGCFVVILGVSNAWMTEQPVSDGTCNIAVLPIDGVIAPYGELSEDGIITNPNFVRSYLQSVTDDAMIKGVLVEINSPGGTPVSAEAMADMIADTTLPTVGLIGDLGASGGYMVAAATDYLIASPMSLVGSIGVTMSYLENTKQNEDDGLTFVELTAGEHKEAGNPNRVLTEEEKAKFKHDLDLVHEAFINKVATYRKLPIDEVKGLADGSGYTGKDALDKKLVDELGGRATARQHFADTLGMNVADIHFCEYNTNKSWI